MSISRRIIVVASVASTLLACNNGSGLASAFRTQLTEITPPPTTTTAIRNSEGVTIHGALLATCAPYTLAMSAQRVAKTLIVTISAQVAGTACPSDVVWTKGFRATITGLPPDIRSVRVLHTTDVRGAAADVLYEGSIAP